MQHGLREPYFDVGLYTPSGLELWTRQVFRLTVELRPVHKLTLKQGSLMPDIDQELQPVTGSRFYVNVHIFHKYCHFYLHPNSQ